MSNQPAAPRVPKRVAAVILNSLKGGVVPRIGLPYITVGREIEIQALLTDLALIADGGASTMSNQPAAPRVPKRVAAVILNSLKGGVVPRIGLPYITVGREIEIQALLTDLAHIAEGGESFRFLVGRYGAGKSFLLQTIRTHVGRYGAGKSFLLQTIRTHAMGEGFVVADADLSPERRLQGGQDLSTKPRPLGGALTLILDNWVANLQAEDDSAAANTPAMNAGSTAGIAADSGPTCTGLRRQLADLEEMVHGFEFTRVLGV